jgi:hypothetical protein
LGKRNCTLITLKENTVNIIKRTLLATMVAASVGSVTNVTTAAAADIYVEIAPPALRYEVVPAPRVGYVWTPGYWDWRGNRHVWVDGAYVIDRPGYYYERPQWIQREGRWYLQRGEWRRGDRDGDGIPNRYDRDRDGDGVPNRYDQRPDNPRRY